MTSPLRKRLLAEFLGTFALIFFGTGAVIVNEIFGDNLTHLGVSMAWGLIVMVLVYSLGDLSGAHLNPAVSIGFATAGRFPRHELLPYILVQFAGAITASATLRQLFAGNKLLGATLPSGSNIQSVVLEILLTLMLMLVILNVSHGAKEKGITAGIAVGAMIGLEALVAGPVCGGSMNPARSLAPALVSGHLEYLWIYLISPVIGSLAAIPLFQFLRGTSGNTVPILSRE
jgi:aquaporin Z